MSAKQYSPHEAAQLSNKALLDAHDECNGNIDPVLRAEIERRLAESDRLQQVDGELLAACEEIIANVPDDIDPRLGYLVVQIERDEWASLIAAVAKAKGTQ